tara:strand:+ start:540 stop:1181 length:642 start_codon:yes stop_codon:yes gene_type:complete
MKENIKIISFLAFVIPIFTVFTSYYFSVKLDLVQFCIPNIDGCTSISRVGRYPPVNYFFKPLMFFSVFIIFLYWRSNYFLLSKNKSLLIYKFTFILGILSVIFFFLYIFFLGEGEYYRFFRRIGIFIYIFFTVISELLLSISYRKNYELFNGITIINFKFYFNLLLSTIGFILLPLVVTKIVDYPNFKNIASWNYFLLIQINFLITFFCWKRV